MDLAGIWTILLVFYAGHFKPQGRVRCGKKNILKYFHFQEGQKSGTKKIGSNQFFFLLYPHRPGFVCLGKGDLD